MNESLEDFNIKHSYVNVREFETSIEKNKTQRRFGFSLEKENQKDKLYNGFDNRSKSK